MFVSLCPLSVSPSVSFFFRPSLLSLSLSLGAKRTTPSLSLWVLAQGPNLPVQPEHSATAPPGSTQASTQRRKCFWRASLSGSIGLSLSLSLSVSLSLSLSLCDVVLQVLSVSVSLCLSVCVSVRVCVSVCLCVCVCVSRSRRLANVPASPTSTHKSCRDQLSPSESEHQTIPHRRKTVHETGQRTT